MVMTIDWLINIKLKLKCLDFWDGASRTRTESTNQISWIHISPRSPLVMWCGDVIGQFCTSTIRFVSNPQWKRNAPFRYGNQISLDNGQDQRSLFILSQWFFILHLTATAHLHLTALKTERSRFERFLHFKRITLSGLMPGIDNHSSPSQWQ